MFEKAAKLKLRFPSRRGSLTAEDLFDLSLPELDYSAKSVHKLIKAVGEESFIDARPSAQDEKLSLALEILKRVIKLKQDEKEAARVRAEKRVKREQIIELMAKKETEELGSKSLEDLKKELEALDED